MDERQTFSPDIKQVVVDLGAANHDGPATSGAVIFVHNGEVCTASPGNGATPDVVVWSQSPQLTASLVSMVASCGIDDVIIRPHPEADETEFVRETLAAAGLNCRTAPHGGVTVEDFMDESESEEVANRLEELGYL